MFRKIFSVAAVLLASLSINAQTPQVSAADIDGSALTACYNGVKTSGIQIADGEKWWSYFDGIYDDDLRLIGLGDNTTVPMLYSAAICIPAGTPASVGQTITGVAFSFLDSKNISDVKIWISEGLPNFAEEATICYQDVTDITGRQNADDPVNEVRFDQPYMINTGKDTYVGYSFVVNADESKSDKFPVLIKGKKTDKGGLYLRFGYEDEWWYDYSSPQYDQYEFGNLALKVLFKGNTEDNAVSIGNTFPDVTSAKNCEVTIPVKVTNLGKKAFTSLGVTVEADGQKNEITVTPDQPVTKDYEFDVKVNTTDEIGEMPVTITIDKVNGQPNASTFNKTEGKVIVLSRIVPHKVVVEEFTGFWCGWCPKGIVAMEKAKQVYGDNVIVATVQYNDALESKEYKVFANQTVASYPQAHVDRTIMSVDPYYGSSLYKCFGISEDIDARAAEVPVAEVKAEAVIDGDVLTATSDVKFLYTGNAHHAVAFVLTENGMQNDNWKQSNNLIQWKGQPIEDLEPMFEEWINGSPEMEGVVFNDVVVAAEGIESGIYGSIPSYVNVDESNTYKMEFDLRKNKKIMDYDELNLCVFLFDTYTGHIINADSKSLNPKASGIDGIQNDDETVETARYTVDGHRIYTPQKGMNIVKYSDGTVKKIMIR